LHDLGLGAALRELVEDAIDLVVVGPAPLGRVEALVADEIGPTVDQIATPLSPEDVPDDPNYRWLTATVARS